MDQIRLFRRRYLPDEITELKDDKVLSLSEDLLITSWDSLRPRDDFSSGVSAYFINLGVKVSKIYTADGTLVHWYCDINEPEIHKEDRTYIFHDLLIDVVVAPDGSTRVVDMDEFADMLEQGVISQPLGIHALRRTDHLLRLIYSGNFSQLTSYIDAIEKTAAPG